MIYIRERNQPSRQTLALQDLHHRVVHRIGICRHWYNVWRTEQRIYLMYLCNFTLPPATLCYPCFKQGYIWYSAMMMFLVHMTGRVDKSFLFFSTA